MLFWFVLAASVLSAQQDPVILKREAVPAEAIPSPDKYPFARIIETLQEEPQPGAAEAPSSSPAGSITPGKDVALPSNARDALTVSQAWMIGRQSPPPAEGKEGRVLYTFGAGLPTVVCAPLRVCVVELQPGEKVVGEPHIGDSVRWMISPATAGKGDSTTPMIVVKPKTVNLDTNLLVATDRRAYYLRLLSKPEEYLARVAFSYPDDETAKWKDHLAKQAEPKRKEEFEEARITPVANLDNLYFNYRVEGGDENMRPIKVVDDGKKTFLQMTPNAVHREAPILVVLGPDGAEMVNYRVKGDLYIVDRLFERGALILGVGKKARKTEIFRGTYRPVGRRGNPFAKFTKEKKP